MSAITNLQAYDGAATPVSHTLVPVSVARDAKGKVTALWREQLASVPVDAQVRASASLERSPSGVSRAELTAVVPIQEVVTGSNSSGYSAAPKVAYENTMRTIGFFSNRSDIAGRRLCRGLHQNILAGLTGTQAIVTTGPSPELFDQLISPT